MDSSWTQERVTKFDQKYTNVYLLTNYPTIDATIMPLIIGKTRQFFAKIKRGGLDLV
jgi:hypothetical protein